MSERTRVLLLTAPECRYCDDARRVLDRLAEEFELDIETRSIDDDAGRALALEHGILFPPGIFVDGAFVQYGRPSERKIRHRLVAAGAGRRTEVRA